MTMMEGGSGSYSAGGMNEQAADFSEEGIKCKSFVISALLLLDDLLPPSYFPKTNVDPPILLLNVAESLCPGFLLVQSLLVWLGFRVVPWEWQ